MTHKITLPLSSDWRVEEEVIKEQGEDVISYYATAESSADDSFKGASIELYLGNSPENSSAEMECINSYVEAFNVQDENEDIPVREIRILGQDGYYYDAEDENGSPVIVICVETQPGTLLMAILAAADEEKLDNLLSLVDENLKIA